MASKLSLRVPPIAHDDGFLFLKLYHFILATLVLMM